MNKAVIPQIYMEISCTFFFTNYKIMDLKEYVVTPTTKFYFNVKQ